MRVLYTAREWGVFKRKGPPCSMQGVHHLLWFQWVRWNCSASGIASQLIVVRTALDVVTQVLGYRILRFAL